MKALSTLAAVTLAACILMCGCGKTDRPEEVKETAAAETTATASETESLPEDEFFELPEGAESDLNVISEYADQVFPDAAGKKMYGYKGEENIDTDQGSISCYVFDYYTYKSKEYTKVGTLAKSVGSAAVYVLDEASNAYSLFELPEKEKTWSETATPALEVNGAEPTANNVPADR